MKIPCPELDHYSHEDLQMLREYILQQILEQPDPQQQSVAGGATSLANLQDEEDRMSDSPFSDLTLSPPKIQKGQSEKVPSLGSGGKKSDNYQFA